MCKSIGLFYAFVQYLAYLIRYMIKIVLLVVGFIFSVSALSDEYTDALDVEASGVTIDYKTNANNATSVEKKPQSDWSFSSQSLSNALPPNLAHKEFESALKKLYYGTYVFYLKLTLRQADDVFDLYQKGISIEKLRDIIMINYRKNI
jgi:hypothetical protein